MTRYEYGFLSKCASSGIDLGVSLGMLKRAAITFDFITGDPVDKHETETLGNGIMTRGKGRTTDYNGMREKIVDYTGKRHHPSDFTEMPEITRLRQADGSFKYRVTRRLMSPHDDGAGRVINDAFSVVVDSPLKAMRLAKGKVSFDNSTQSLFNKIHQTFGGEMASKASRLRDGEIGISNRKYFDIPKKFSLTSDGVDRSIFKVKKVNIDEQKLNYFKVLKRLAKLHPGKTKAIAAAVAALGIGGAGATTAAVVHKKKKR